MIERVVHKVIHTQTMRWFAAACTFFVGGIILLFGPSRLEYPAPFYLSHLAPIIDSFILAATFYASIGLIIGKRRAWQVAIAILAISTVWETIESREAVGFTSLFPLLALVIVSFTHRNYQLKSESSSINPALGRALIFSLITTTIGCLSFFIFTAITRHHFRLIPSMLQSLDQMYSIDTIGTTPFGHLSVVYLLDHSFLLLLGVTNYLVMAFALLKPVVDRFHLTPDIHMKVYDLLTRYGTSSEDFFKYFPNDKSYFFSHGTEGFIAYGVHQTICVALADPIAANDADRTTLLIEFKQFCTSNGWLPVFVPVGNTSRQLYTKQGFRTLKIGENAIVELAHIVADSGDKKSRNIMNRFTKQGYSHSIETGPHSPALLGELQAVSDDWLAYPGRQERKFAMGYFSDSYLQSCRLFIVRNKDGQIVAFVNLQPSFSRRGRASIDMMRARPGAPSNVMDYLFMQLMRTLRTEGWASLDIGLAPLSGLEQSKTMNERGLHLLYRYAGRWFAFKGLRRFKNKFNPTWEPQFLAYSGLQTRLPAIAIAVNELMKSHQD
ncbi:MAG: bifunctional lysylphosphatidylglycerol flippase/synthetase MprF [Candidatus Saccharimonadales bacterium]